MAGTQSTESVGRRSGRAMPTVQLNKPDRPINLDKPASKPPSRNASRAPSVPKAVKVTSDMMGKKLTEKDFDMGSVIAGLKGEALNRMVASRPRAMSSRPRAIRA